MKKRNKKNRPKSSTFNKKNLKNAILTVFYDNPQKSFNYKQLASELGVKDPEIRRLVSVVLDELSEDQTIEQVFRGKYKVTSRGGQICGRVELQPQGFGLVVSDEIDQPVLVSQRNLNHAMEGDKVRVTMYARRKKHQLEGEVTEIIERAKTTFVGTIERSRNFAFLIPVGKVGFDLFIPNDKLNGAVGGQKAVARITEWPTRAKNPFGEVIEVLGNAGENDTEMHAILAEFDLPLRFPENVLKAAERIPLDIPDEEIEKRRDMRDVTTFTIDPADAKDFDDALSVRQLKEGLWEVGVHIADVSHYVKPNTILDDEAYSRATSVYLVDRVVPMLPEKLSNGVCSLRPNEDKLCFSAVFKMNEDGEVLKEWFGRTVIHSNRRFTYEEAQEIIETGEGDLKEEILQLNTLAVKLRSKRFKEGSLAFDRIEVKFEIDEKGKPLSVFFKESKDSNKLIEEFMLLANKRVAESIGKEKGGKQARTFVYRIHDKPDPEKLENFNHFIKKFGYGIQTTSAKTISTSMNELMETVKGKSEQNVVETLAIRSMAKAEYSTRNIGHYGLGFQYYSHFTSPIRRYPDVMVHRLLERYLDGGRSANAQKFEDYCKHSSEMESRAANAERSSIKYKQVEFMKDKIGQTFPGVISGITDWGLYVELENKCEGMVPMRELDDDFYMFDEKNYCLVGNHSKRTYQLGESVWVEIMRANLEKKQLDFKLVKKPDVE
ncbi:ribonuclease R [Mangrovibacterium diazotrophicum]|uniref:Ribonuclease R n=1 Tax=Mangrovibacterium diazotrophicum TaxID=1261403 RepID=A0A419W9P1_9BACT|nr:ribonuclease R [Mangrovibacterium diazotrophicum]RKD92180.1 ribonuclease R [Mangrovibacterium diazotrophicum]